MSKRKKKRFPDLEERGFSLSNTDKAINKKKQKNVKKKEENSEEEE